MRTILLAAAFFALPAAVASAEPNSITLHVSADQLKSDADLAILLTSIEDAAKTLCKQESAAPPLIAGAERSCRKASVRDAIAEAKIAPLTAYYASAVSEPMRHDLSPTLASR